MDKVDSNVFSNNQTSISLWEQPEESTYYDRKMDLQGEVPGGSIEEAKNAFDHNYGTSLFKK